MVSQTQRRGGPEHPGGAVLSPLDSANMVRPSRKKGGNTRKTASTPGPVPRDASDQNLWGGLRLADSEQGLTWIQQFGG